MGWDNDSERTPQELREKVTSAGVSGVVRTVVNR
jgi:phosphoribosylformimino-5-aminoimidazole carboxamide ribonucleotide (ProFAR) isomerase